MVITSSTQWTIPLSSSSIAAVAASPPSLSKHGSVLGLKTCQLSAPPLELHDLHSTSSRRLLTAPDASNRRSAGSLRQLVSDDLCSKTPDFPYPDSPDWLYGKVFDAPHDGIAMPWSSNSLHPHAFDVAPVGTFDANLADFHGEITAEDVDLLPLAGLLSCPSPFYADSFIPHAQSPRSSKRSTEVSSPQCSGNSCKSSVMVPNHLGLPPNFNVEVDPMASTCGGFTNVRQTKVHEAPLAHSEHASRDGSNHPPFPAGNHVFGKDTDNFNDSLAGFWTNSSINCDSDLMLYDSESLASIFNVFPQKFHEMSSSGRIDQSHANTCNDMAHSVVDDLHYLGNPIGEACDSKAKVSGSFHAVSASEAYKIVENSGSMMWEATKQEAQGQPCISMPHSNATEPSAMLSEASLFGSTDTASSLEKKCESVGMKRPFSMLQLAGIASSTASSTGISGTNAWHPQPTSMPLKEEAVKHSFSSMLYKSQKDPKLAGFYYHMAKEHARMDEDMMPQPSPAKVRRKHGTAMDPQSVAARTRREKFSDRIRILQSLVPNGERLDTVSMLGQTLEYVRFLQHQVWQLYHGKDPVSPGNTCEKWKDFVEAERTLAKLA